MRITRKTTSAFQTYAKSFTGLSKSNGRKRVALSSACRPIAERLEERRLLTSLGGIDLTQLGTEISSTLTSTQTKLSPLLDHQLPIVGSKLSDAVTTLNTLATNLSTAFGTQNQISAVEQSLATALGPQGLNILTVNGDGSFPAADETEVDNSGTVTQIEFKLPLHHVLADTGSALNFNTGIAGLNLTTSGKIKVAVGYNFQLDFGDDASTGFFIDTTPTPSTATTLPFPGTHLNLTADMTLPGASATGMLGPLELTVKDHANGDAFAGSGADSYGPTDFNAAFSVDFTSSDSSDQNLTDPGNLRVDMTLSGDAKLNLDATVSFGTDDFPSLTTLFHLDWSFSATPVAADPSGSVSGFGSAPTIGFANVSLDLGSFFNNLVTPVISEVQSAIAPFQPFLTFMNKPAPIFNDFGPLRSIMGVPDGTTFTIADLLSTFDPSVGSFVNTLISINNFVQSFQPAAFGSGYGVSLGSFDLPDARSISDLQSVTPVDVTGKTVSQIEDEMGTVAGQIGSAGSRVGAFLSNIGNSFDGGEVGGSENDGGTGKQGSLDFPILDQPSTAFGMLLGKPVNLFTFTMPTLSLNIAWSQFFTIFGPLGVTLRGNVHDTSDVLEMAANLSGGYDTQGIIDAQQDDFAPSKLANDLAQGFFLNTGPASGLTVDLGIEADASLNIIIASAGVGGGIDGSFSFNLHDDGTGKIRLAEIQSLGVSNLFDINGIVTANLDAFAQIGFDTPFGFVGWQDHVTLASATLFTFGFVGNPSSPVSTSVTVQPDQNIAEVNEFEGYTATVTAADGSTPSGNVSFELSGPLTETVTVACVNGKAVLPAVEYPTVGTETILAFFAASSPGYQPSTNLFNQFSTVIRGPIFVDQTAEGLDNGTTWANAYLSLATAEANALPGDTIEMAQGDYIPAGAPGNTFTLQAIVGIVGGYPSGGAQTPNPNLYVTTLDDFGANTPVISGSGAGFTFVSGVTITGGHAGGPAGVGGAVDFQNGFSASFSNCIFTGNSATLGGGAVYTAGGASLFSDCTFSGNSAPAGSVIDCVGGVPEFLNCTIANNTGVAVFDSGNAKPTFINCILWNDSGGEVHDVSGSSAQISYSDIDQTGYAGSNLDVDGNPDFINGLNIQSPSLCINSGSNAAAAGFKYDLAGNSRNSPSNGVVDMGAYEYQGPFVLYVDPSAHGAQTGTSWANAFNTLSQALTYQSPGYTIYVAQGDYATGTTPQNTFQLMNGVTILGGYAPGNSHARNPALYVSALDGNNTSNYVVTGSGTNSTAVLDGFTIENGHSTGNGGGLLNLGGSPKIVDCTFLNNHAAGNGGAIANIAIVLPHFNPATLRTTEETIPSLPILVDCIFANNSAANGGAIYNSDSSPNLFNCIFYNNTASGDGGGIYDDQGASPTLVNCSFNANTALQGGAIAAPLLNTSNPIVINSILWNDQATGYPLSDEILNHTTVSYSDVDGGYSGTTNINSDPLFISSTNLQVQSGSPVIHAGQVDAATASESSIGTSIDLAGNPRIDHIQTGINPPRTISYVDMGAYEFQGATTLFFAQTPPVSVPIGVKFDVFVSLSQKGHFSTSDNSMVTLNLYGPSTSAGKGPLVETLQEPSIDGQAAFESLSVLGAGGNYTFNASDGGDVPASATFGVTNQGANSGIGLSFKQEPTDGYSNTKLFQPVQVEVFLDGQPYTQDSFSSVTLFIGQTQIAVASVNQGVAYFGDLTFTDGTYSLYATDGNYGPITSTPFTITDPVPPPTLTFSDAPPNIIADTPIDSEFTVTQDQNGSPLADGSIVTLTVASAPSDGALTQTVNMITTTGPFQAIVDGNGVAHFSGFTATAFGKYVLKATDGNDVLTSPLEFVAAQPAPPQLVFLVQPGDYNLGSDPHVPEFEVEVELNGVLDPVSDLIRVTVDIPSPDAFSGTLNVQAVDGVATFDNYFVGTALPTTLLATDLTDPSSSPGVSNAFNVTPGPAFSVGGSSTSVAGSTFSATADAFDLGLNVDTSYSGSVDFTLVSGPAGATLGGTYTANFQNGVGAVTNLFEDLAGDYVLQPVGPLTRGEVDFTITAAAPSQLVFINQPGTASTGTELAPAVTVAVEDQFGNLVDTDSSTLALSLAAPALNELGGTISVNAQNGIATFSQFDVKEIGTYNLVAADSDNSVAPATSAPFSIVAPAIVFVDQSATGANNGQDWPDAYLTLQQALAVVIPGDTIEVAQGDYSPGTDPTDTFQLLNGVTIQGGYQVGGFAGPDTVDYPTILDGASINYHVITGTGTDSTAILSGFTITNGNANGGGDTNSSFGGGMIVDGGSPTISNCLFSDNTALYAFVSGGNGGAVYDNNASPTITNCTFVNNTSASNSAGAIYNIDSSPTLTDDIFRDNSASNGSGGAIYNLNSSPTITNCLFVGNSAVLFGGAIYDDGSSPTITNCTFTGNFAADDDGGAILNTSASNPILTNCILWNDTAANGEISAIPGSGASDPTVNNSDIDGGYAGKNNIDADPLFVDTANANYQLQPASPCINSGDNAASGPTNVATDLAANSRIFDNIIDMGAYEATSITVSWTGAGDGANWSDPTNWSDGQAPTQNDSVIINAALTSIQVTAGSDAAQTLTSSSPIEITSGATLVLSGQSIVIGGLTVDAGGTLKVAADPVVLVVNGSNFIDNGTVDLTDNDMIVQNGDLSEITSLIASGFKGGLWNGIGITSSSAAATSNMALGVELNDDGTGTPLMTTFDGQTVSDADLLIKYTFFGDTNLDGVVDATDYISIDNGFTMGLTGWRYGDFNYDGVINGDDYTLIDNAFNTQETVSFAAVSASQIAGNTAQIAETTNAPSVSSRHVMPGSSIAISPPAQIGTTADGGTTDLRKRHRTVWLALEESNS